MENQIVPNNDIQFLASRSNQNLSVIIAGMTDLMEENDAKVAMLENQDWFQRMSYTITGQNKMTQREIQQNHDKINLYVTQALGELYNQNCINHEIILGLGNRINELYASQVEIKQIIGAFAQKLNEKIESIDSYHILVTEINQGVYRNKNKFVSLCQIMSQLDLRTVKDDRKMNILIRAMEEQEILKEKRVTILNVLKELLEVSDNEAGMLMIFLGNIRSDMLANVMEQTLYAYYTVPEMIRPNINKNSIVENILAENSIDSSNAFSTYDLCVTLIDAYVNNIFEVAIEQQKNEEEEKKEYIEEYLNKADNYMYIICNMAGTWLQRHGELNTPRGRRKYANFLSKLIDTVDLSSYSGSDIVDNLETITCFIKKIISRFSDIRVESVKCDGFIDEMKIYKNISLELPLTEPTKYVNIIEHYTQGVKGAFFKDNGEANRELYAISNLADRYGVPNYWLFLCIELNFMLMKCFYNVFEEYFLRIRDKINDSKHLEDIYNICSMFPLNVDEGFDDDLYRYDYGTEPYIEFSYSNKDGNIKNEDGNVSIGGELDSMQYDSLHIGINIKNFYGNRSFTLVREIIENSATDGNGQICKYVDIDWGDATDDDFEMIISKYNDYRFGILKIKVYVKEYPNIVGYIV